jgi:hypothetical protein
MKGKINFLIIGAQKAATTTLYSWLQQHPDVFLPKTKEIVFFANEDFYQQGERYLDIFYNEYKGQRAIGSNYVQYIYFPNIASRIYSYNPNIKLIAVLRNPIERAYSAYWFARSNGRESEESFEKALEKEEKGSSDWSFDDQADCTYLSHGRYAEQLKVYLNIFRKDQLLVLLTEQLRNNPFEALSTTLGFLELPIDRDQFNLSFDKNIAAKPRLYNLQKVLMEPDYWYKHWWRKLFPAPLRQTIREGFTKRIISWNRIPFRYPEMSSETRAKLVEYFKPLNDELEQLIGMDLSSWNS